MERGHYGVRAEDGQQALADGVIERLAPLALSKLVIDNEFRTDLEEELWGGDEITEEIREAGKRAQGLKPVSNFRTFELSNFRTFEL